MRHELVNFRNETKDSFHTLATRYDSISETLAKVVQQSTESSNELKQSMATLIKSLDNLTALAKNYFEERRQPKTD